MSFIEVEYCTWEREETYGMFDYSEQKGIKKYPKLVIKQPGKLFRNFTQQGEIIATKLRLNYFQ